MKPLSNDLVCSVKKLLGDGLSIRKIAQKLNIGKSTVSRLGAKHFGDRLKAKTGRPVKLTNRDRQYCVRQITVGMGNKENAVEVTKSLREDLGIHVSPDTVRRSLHASGISSIIKPKKPHLSHKNARVRLEWAKSHADWTLDDWSRVIWSDETRIDRFGSDGKIYAWKRDTDPLSPRHVQQTRKHGGGNIMIWSCITWQGVGFVVKVDGIMDQALYKNILEDDLLNSMDEYHLQKSRIIFQHDNDIEKGITFAEKLSQSSSQSNHRSRSKSRSNNRQVSVSNSRQKQSSNGNVSNSLSLECNQYFGKDLFSTLTEINKFIPQYKSLSTKEKPVKLLEFLFNITSS